MTHSFAELGAVLGRLSSAEPEAQIGAVEELIHVSNQVVDRVLQEFAKPGPARYLIFERLGRFGSLIVEPLEQLLERSGDDRELRVLAAAALLSFNSRVGVGFLLDAVRPEDPLVCLAAGILAKSKVAEAAPRLHDAIKQCALHRTAVLECLTTALWTFTNPLPEDVEEHLRGMEPGWLRDSLLRR